MTLANDSSARITCDDRTRSLTLRMLRGAAATSLFAYHLEEGLDLVTHGLTRDGSLALAAVPDGLLKSLAPGYPTQVRMDLLKHSPDPRVSLVAASLHLLGTLVWVSHAEALLRRETGDLPPMVDAMLDAPGARLGFVDMEKVVLHDLSGPTPIPLDALDLPTPGIDDPFAAFDLVASRGGDELKDLCWAVMVGIVPGVVLRKPALPHQCSHTTDQVFCADVDPTGITLMLVGQHETIVAFAQFSSPAWTQAELADRVDDVLAQATPPDAVAS